MPTRVLPVAAPRAVTVNVYTAVSTRHNGDNTQARTRQKKTRNRHESDPTGSPGLLRSPRISQEGWWRHCRAGLCWEAALPSDFHTTLTTTSTAGTTRGATRHWKLKAYNRSRGQGDHASASLPLIKKQNNPKHTMLQTFQQHLWPPVLQELNCWQQDSNPIFPSLWEGLLGGWHFPGTMPFWQVSSSSHFLSPPPTGLQPERGQRGEMTDSKAILQCQKKMYLAFFLFFFLK